MPPVKSDRSPQLTRLITLAEKTFGDADRAKTWLARRTCALGGASPIDIADTDEGARAVKTLLGRIDHGIAA